MKLRNVRVLVTPLLLAALLLAAPAVGQERVARERTLIQAYVTVVKAEQSLKQGDKKEAIESYAIALRMFRQLMTDHPEWRSTVVREQIPHCINEIKLLLEDDELNRQYGAELKDRLKLTFPDRASPPRKADTARVPVAVKEERTVDVLSRREQDLLSVNAELRSRLLSLEMTTAEMRREIDDSPKLKAAERRCEKLRRENVRLAEERKKAREQIKDLDRRVRVLTKIQQEAETSTEEKAELQKTLTAVEARYKELLEEKMKVDGEGDTRPAPARPGQATTEVEIAALRLELEATKEDYGALTRRNAVLAAQIEDRAATGNGSQPKKGTPAEVAGFIRGGEFVNARDSIAGGLSRSPGDRQLRLMLGILYCKEGNYDAAARTLKKLVADEREDVDIQAHLALGGAYMALGNHKNAKLELEMVIAFEPNMSEGHFNLAQVLLAEDPPDAEGARRSYVEALERGAKADPKFEELLSRLLKKTGAKQGKKARK
jgi:tetratricopeptide (TPR) repeat protein